MMEAEMKNGLAGYQFSGEPESSGTELQKKTNVVKAKRENVEKFTTQSELLKLLKRQL